MSVFNSNFKPFSFEEAAKPYILYTQYARGLEDEAASINEAASSMGELMKDSPNYIQANAQLGELSEQIANGELTPQTRRQLRDLRSKFNTIQKGVDEWNTMSKAREDILSKTGGMAIFNSNYNSPDAFIGGKKADNSYINGASVLKEASAGADLIGSSLVGESIVLPTNDDTKKQIVTQKGASLEEVQDLFEQPIDYQDSDLGKLRYNLFLKYNGDKITDPAAQQQLISYLNEGMYNAVKAPQVQVVGNDDLSRTREKQAIEQANLSIRQTKINMGMLPYKEDEDGTEHYMNTSTGMRWKVSKDANGKKTTTIEPNEEPKPKSVALPKGVMVWSTGKDDNNYTQEAQYDSLRDMGVLPYMGESESFKDLSPEDQLTLLRLNNIDVPDDYINAELTGLSERGTNYYKSLFDTYSIYQFKAGRKTKLIMRKDKVNVTINPKNPSEGEETDDNRTK